eukprot:1177479-Prorocentrum_minimum.AAC.1
MSLPDFSLALPFLGSSAIHLTASRPASICSRTLASARLRSLAPPSGVEAGGAVWLVPAPLAGGTGRGSLVRTAWGGVTEPALKGRTLPAEAALVVLGGASPLVL